MAAVHKVYESEYELDRERKIQENNEMMKRIFGDNILELLPPSPSARKQHVRAKSCSPFGRRRTKTAVQQPVRRNPKRDARSYPTKEENVGEEESDTDSDSASVNKLVVRWVGPLTKKRRTGSDSVNTNSEHELSDESDASFTRKRRVYSPRVIRPCSDFSEEELLLIASCTSEKRKDAEYGTTCHQCRQKTDDLKTTCRNESCLGVRGQFCGPCLKNRYGEIVRDALLDEDWSCPPCRNICNCSFCMVKRGRRCTGQMISVARQNGYEDVRSFLGD